MQGRLYVCVEEQDPRLKGITNFHSSTTGMRIASCDYPDLRPNIETFFIRGIRTDRDFRRCLLPHESYGNILQIIMKINKSVDDFNREMMRIYGR